MSSAYHIGRAGEKELRKMLEEMSYTVFLSGASRGPADLIAWRSRYAGISREKHVIQVKNTSRDYIQIDRQEARELLEQANDLGGSAELAVWYGNGESVPWCTSRKVAHKPECSTRHGERSLKTTTETGTGEGSSL